MFKFRENAANFMQKCKTLLLISVCLSVCLSVHAWPNAFSQMNPVPQTLSLTQRKALGGTITLLLCLFGCRRCSQIFHGVLLAIGVGAFLSFRFLSKFTWGALERSVSLAGHLGVHWPSRRVVVMDRQRHDGGVVFQHQRLQTIGLSMSKLQFKASGKWRKKTGWQTRKRMAEASVVSSNSHASYTSPET